MACFRTSERRVVFFANGKCCRFVVVIFFTKGKDLLFGVVTLLAQGTGKVA
ncbi:MAG: hypothetical protein ACT4NY_34155 [Pseudonocardiales bacterium]